MPPYLALLVWDDAHGSAVEQVTLSSVAEAHKAAVFQTVGWILLDDDAGVSIANERCLDEGEESYRGRTFVPRALIRSVTPLNKPRKPRKKAAT